MKTHPAVVCLSLAIPSLAVTYLLSSPLYAANHEDINRLFTTLNGSLIHFLTQLKTPLYIAEGLSGMYLYYKTKNVFSLFSIAALALFLNAMIQYVGP